MAGLLARGYAPLVPSSRTHPRFSDPPHGVEGSSDLPLTVAGAAADLSPGLLALPGRTAFPFHPFARDHRPQDLTAPGVRWQPGEAYAMRAFGRPSQVTTAAIISTMMNVSVASALISGVSPERIRPKIITGSV
jgi:hypothetical protein